VSPEQLIAKYIEEESGCDFSTSGDWVSPEQLIAKYIEEESGSDLI
jgi:hypothetical protein